MKIACQEGMAPGDTLEEKFAHLEEFGFEGIEFSGRFLREKVEQIKQIAARSTVKPSSICAGFRGCLLDADKEQRDLAVGDIKELLSMGADLGVVGLILVPLFGPPRLPDLSPLADPIKLERQLFLKILDELGEHAAQVKCRVLVEPLNRYETHYLNRLEQAIDVCRVVDNPYVKIMADFFHMHIEERDIAASIRKAGKKSGKKRMKGGIWIQHVHLADSTRELPGYGHTDFVSGFGALKSVGFDKYMALECKIPGDPMVDLPKCAQYLRDCIAQASAK